jgi:hypothetical protein
MMVIIVKIGLDSRRNSPDADGGGLRQYEGGTLLAADGTADETYREFEMSVSRLPENVTDIAMPGTAR